MIHTKQIDFLLLGKHQELKYPMYVHSFGVVVYEVNIVNYEKLLILPIYFIQILYKISHMND